MTPTAPNLRVLFVEPSARDMQLVAEILHEATEMLPGSYVFDVVTSNFGALERVARSKYRLVCVAQESRSTLDGRRAATVLKRCFPDLTVVLLLDDDKIKPHSQLRREKANKFVRSTSKRAGRASFASPFGKISESSSSSSSVPRRSTLSAPPPTPHTLITPFAGGSQSSPSCGNEVFPNSSEFMRNRCGDNSEAGGTGGGGGLGGGDGLGGEGSIGGMWPGGGSAGEGLVGGRGVMNAKGMASERVARSGGGGGAGRIGVEGRRGGGERGGGSEARAGTEPVETLTLDGFAASFSSSCATTRFSLYPSWASPSSPTSPPFEPSLALDLNVVDYVLRRPFSDETFRLLLEATEEDPRRVPQRLKPNDAVELRAPASLALSLGPDNKGDDDELEGRGSAATEAQKGIAVVDPSAPPPAASGVGGGGRSGSGSASDLGADPPWLPELPEPPLLPSPPERVVSPQISPRQQVPQPPQRRRQRQEPPHQQQQHHQQQHLQQQLQQQPQQQPRTHIGFTRARPLLSIPIPKSFPYVLPAATVPAASHAGFPPSVSLMFHHHHPLHHPLPLFPYQSHWFQQAFPSEPHWFHHAQRQVQLNAQHQPMRGPRSFTGVGVQLAGGVTVKPWVVAQHGQEHIHSPPLAPALLQGGRGPNPANLAPAAGACISPASSIVANSAASPAVSGVVAHHGHGQERYTRPPGLATQESVGGPIHANMAAVVTTPAAAPVEPAAKRARVHGSLQQQGTAFAPETPTPETLTVLPSSMPPPSIPDRPRCSPNDRDCERTGADAGPRRGIVSGTSSTQMRDILPARETTAEPKLPATASSFGKEHQAEPGSAVNGGRAFSLHCPATPVPAAPFASHLTGEEGGIGARPASVVAPPAFGRVGTPPPEPVGSASESRRGATVLNSLASGSTVLPTACLDSSSEEAQENSQAQPPAQTGVKASAEVPWPAENPAKANGESDNGEEHTSQPIPPFPRAFRAGGGASGEGSHERVTAGLLLSSSLL